MSLPKRRIYVSLVETPSQAELSLYERSDSKVRVSRWKGKPAPDLRMSLDSAILENKGVHCVGEQTKAIVGKLAGLSSEPEVPSPASAAAAFGHSVKAHERDYIRATFYLLC
jgi:hypothetical protein